MAHGLSEAPGPGQCLGEHLQRTAQGQLQLALTNKYLTLLAFDPHKGLFIGVK